GAASCGTGRGTASGARSAATSAPRGCKRGSPGRQGGIGRGPADGGRAIRQSYFTPRRTRAAMLFAADSAARRRRGSGAGGRAGQPSRQRESGAVGRAGRSVVAMVPSGLRPWPRREYDGPERGAAATEGASFPVSRGLGYGILSGLSAPGVLGRIGRARLRR